MWNDEFTKTKNHNSLNRSILAWGTPQGGTPLQSQSNAYLGHGLGVEESFAEIVSGQALGKE
jgi:hypothetical protein